MVARPQPGLLGRAAECGALDQVLDEARAGHSAMLVVHGEAGVGKSALLHHCARQAVGFRVARIAGAELEMDLPFAALHLLCAPMLGRLDALPAPQQRALRIAFGLSAGAAPDRAAVGAAALGLLAEAAVARPLLCLVDDAQWLDAASADALGVAARLPARSVAIVLAVLDGSDRDAFRGLPEVALGALGTVDARALLADAVPVRLDAGVRDRLIAETRGNPQALLELARASAEGHEPRVFEAVPSSEVRARLDGLSEDARGLLLLAAADPTGDPRLLACATERLGIGSAAAAGDARGLLAIGERVAFLDPLARSVVYRSAAAEDRRRVHLTLAELTDPQVDADRRAWHLAAAAPGPDEEIATELERSSGQAQARAGIPAAAAFLRRSVELTRDPERRMERALAAAQASLHAGAFDAAFGALAAAAVGPLDALQGARVELLRGEITLASGSAADAAPLLLGAARRLAPLDLALAREAYLGACGAAMSAGPAGAEDLLRVARAVTALPPDARERRAVDLLLDGLALLITEGRRAAAPALLQAAASFADEGASVEESLRWGWMATAAGNALWDDDGLRAVCRRQIALAREAGALAHLPVSLIALATAVARGGDFAEASTLMADADAVTEATGTHHAPFAGRMLLASLRGSEAEVTALKQGAIDQATDAGQGIAATVADWTTAILYNGLGRYDEALIAAQRAGSAPGDRFAAMWALPELIESASRSGETRTAAEALKRLARTTRPAGTDFGLGIEARSRALLREGDGAEQLHREAIERLARTQQRSELARAHLLYGEWLRRAGRRKAAREQLQTAQERFTAMGMAAFAERADRERLATGETLRRRATDTRDVLTPQEAQIARLARDGLSNPEIAARLFLSPRTVEWHLKKVFSKLGISSRQGLPDALPSEDRDATATRT